MRPPPLKHRGATAENQGMNLCFLLRCIAVLAYPFACLLAVAYVYAY